MLSVRWPRQRQPFELTLRRPSMKTVRTFLYLALLIVVALGVVSRAQAAEKLLLFAPSSMTDVMAQVARSYTTETGQDVVVSVAGTAQLARQLDNGAPADVFISADEVWIDWLADRQLMEKGQAQVFAGNNLVVAVRNETENWVDVKAAVSVARFAMAEPEAVPAGRYARQALGSLGLWEKASRNAVFGENVRVTLRQLALGEVGAAIVYATDAAIEPLVRTAWTFPADSHDPVKYIAGPVRGAKPGADGFVEHLQSAAAQALLRKAGFTRAPLEEAQ